MSYQATKYVISLRTLTPAEKAVAHSLAYHAHQDGTESYPSMETIAQESGLKRRQNAQRIVKRLEEKGIIVPTSPKKGGRAVPTHYRLAFENCNRTVALSDPENCNSTVALSGPENCNRDGEETATVQLQNCNRTVARIVRGTVNKEQEVFFDDSEMEEAFQDCVNYFAEVSNRDPEKFLSIKRKRSGFACLKIAIRMRDGNLDEAVEVVQGSIDSLADWCHRKGKDVVWEYLFNEDKFENWAEPVSQRITPKYVYVAPEPTPEETRRREIHHAASQAARKIAPHDFVREIRCTGRLLDYVNEDPDNRLSAISTMTDDELRQIGEPEGTEPSPAEVETETREEIPTSAEEWF